MHMEEQLVVAIGQPVFTYMRGDWKLPKRKRRVVQIDLYTQLLGGFCAHTEVVLSRRFGTRNPIKNPLGGALIEYGMTMKVTGKMDFHVLKGCGKVPAVFYMKTSKITRSDEKQQERKAYEAFCKSKGWSYESRIDTDGPFNI